MKVTSPDGDRVPRLTKREEAALALSSLESGRGVPARQAHTELRALVRDARTAVRDAKVGQNEVGTR